MTEVYIQFDAPVYGYDAGTIVRAQLLDKDKNGVHVRVFSRRHNELVNAWSDLGGFHEVPAMEIIARAVNGESFL